MVLAGGVTTSDGAGCYQTQTDPTGNGHSISAGTAYNTSTGDALVTFNYNVQLGIRQIYNSKLDCTRMYNQEVQKQSISVQKSALELRKMQLEMELLEERIRNERARNKANNMKVGEDGLYPSLVGDDW